MAAASAAVMENVRPHAGGKFLYLGDQKFYVRGVTYGTFRPDADGGEYHSPDVVERDFAQMAANGINAVRTYTVPPRWLLDTAQRHGLRVMVGLPWEQHVAFLDDNLGRLHNLAGERPLVLAEIGLHSRRHGADAQERALPWQVRTAFASGCAGAFVFAWTDDWYRGGYDIKYWDFGLIDRARQP